MITVGWNCAGPVQWWHSHCCRMGPMLGTLTAKNGVKSRRAMLDTLLRHLPMVRLSAIAALAALMGCTGLIDSGESGQLTAEEKAARELYIQKAKPVLDQNCASCHSGSDPTIAFVAGA